MFVTATEFRTNVGLYMEMASRETVMITKHGSVVAMLSGEMEARRMISDKLIGCMAGFTGDPDKVFEERIKDYEDLV